jgi:O-antigen/teichoic acid export membrane protein
MEHIKAIRTKLSGSTLHANSIYLMAAQGIMTVCGYLFWIVVARLYDTHTIGLASALIAVATLIANISILGFNNALIRFLPTSTTKSAKINTALWLVGGLSGIAAIGYLLLINVFSPDLEFVRHNLLFAALFVGSMFAITLNTLTDSIFVAYRATKYNITIYSAYGLLRLAAPFLLVSLGVAGIFLSHMIGIFAAVALSFYFMITKLDYKPFVKPSRSILKQIGGYSLANYLAGFLWSLPLLVAPLLIVNQLSPTQNAYFYMVMMIINVLLIIPTAATQSLFAEGSHAGATALTSLVKKTLKFGLLLELAGIVGVLLLGKFALSIFGAAYASEGATLLYLLALSGIFVAINMTGNSVLKIHKKIGQLMAINIFGALSTLGLMGWLIGSHGLAGVGLAYLIGQILMAIVYGLLALRATRS